MRQQLLLLARLVPTLTCTALPGSPNFEVLCARQGRVCILVQASPVRDEESFSRGQAGARKHSVPYVLVGPLFLWTAGLLPTL